MWTYGHIPTKYEVSMSNPAARRGVHRRRQREEKYVSEQANKHFSK